MEDFFLADADDTAAGFVGFADFVLLEEDGVAGLTLLLPGDDFLLLEVLEGVVRDFACLTDLLTPAVATFFVVVLLFGNAFGGVTDLRVFFMVEGMIFK